MKNIILVFIIVFLTSCTNNSTKTSTVNTVSNSNIGYFYDALTNGIEYTCGTISGITGDQKDANGNLMRGSFAFKNDCDVVFSIGKIYLGKYSGKDIIKNDKNYVFPTNIAGVSVVDTNHPKVVNILRFIQSLDVDNDPSNGIDISQSSRENLAKTDVISLDLTQSDINETILSKTIKKADTNKTLISTTKAIAHFETTIRREVDPDVDTVAPAKPTLTETFTAINTEHTTYKDIEINGEVGAKIFIAFNTDGNTSSLNFIDTNLTIDKNGKQIIRLNFDDDTVTNFHYFIMLQDSKEHNSSYYHLNVRKDVVPPQVASNDISIYVIEEQEFIQNINATDNSGTLYYSIINSNEDNRSTNWQLFQIDDSGNVTFITEPDYDNNIGARYSVVARAKDDAGNMTDVLLNVILSNILDNPPKLTASDYNTSIIEGLPNGATVYELNSTIDTNLSRYPDNDPNLSPIYYKLLNHNDKFEVELNTGVLKIKNSADPLFDYEQSPNSIELNISVENNNTSPEGNITYATLTIDIINKIDTPPKLIAPTTNYTIDENTSGGVSFGDPIAKNIALSDRNLSMVFSISAGDTSKFSIDPNTGRLITAAAPNLDYESAKQHIITVRATNRWYDNSEHYDEVNVTIDINNLIDNPPVIALFDLNATLPENTAKDIKVAQIDVNGTYYDHNQTDSYSINSGVPFKINNNGEVFTSRTLLNDYNETLNNNSVTSFPIEVTATNIAGVSNTVSFTINVTNVIDNPPVLLSPTTTIVKEENTTTPIGSFIYQIETNGVNYDENNVTRYSIVSGNDDNKFDINETNGTIIVKNLFDWEEKTSYSLELQASNIAYDGSTLNSNIVTLNVNITNKIEKKPKIKGPTTLNIHENIDVGQIIAVLETNSSEKDEQTIRSFSIVSGNDGNFTISLENDSNSNLPIGNLKIASTIDYETNSSYTLDINATNEAGSTTHTININVIDDVDTDLPLLVIGVNYNDINLTATQIELKNLIFGTTFKKLNDYFDRVSKKKFKFAQAKEKSRTVTNDTSSLDDDGVLEVSLNKNHPAVDDKDIFKPDIEDALILSDNIVDYSIFDKNNDGNISSDELQILFVIAGGERTYGDDNQSVRAHVGSFDHNITLDGKNIAYDEGGGNYVVVGEQNNGSLASIGLIAQNLGHSALKFPFLHDTTYASYGIGFFGLMGYGYRGADENEAVGTTPVNISAYNILKQGWVYPTTITKTTRNISLVASNQGVNGFNIIKIPTNDPKIYYLIENRVLTNKNGYDEGFYAMENKPFVGGLAVWRINENKTNNDIVTDKLVDLVEYDETDDGLDKKEHLGKSTLLYHAGDTTYTNVDNIFTIENSSIDSSTNTMIIDIVIP